jgi:hypothetical protein
MPLHYALTDALVALIACWGVVKLWRTDRPLAALGLSLFGLAGAIGTIRITSGLIEPLAMLHKGVSQLGGIAGLTLLLAQILRDKGLRLGTGVVLSVAVALAALVATLPALGAALFVLMLVAAIALCLQSRNQLAAAGFVVMLLNVTLVRQSGYLGADLSWHLYHLFVATWLLCVAYGFAKAPGTA